MSELLGLSILACATTASGIFTLAYAAAKAPAPQARRLGLRGLKRQRALEQVALWSLLEPTLRWLGGRFAGLVSDDWKRQIDRRITLAGDYRGLLPEETIGLCVLTTGLGLALGIVLGALSGMNHIAAVGGLLIGASTPYMRLGSAADLRLAAIERRLPHAVDLLALAMGAGLDFPGSVRQVVEKSGHPEEPLIEEFTLILQNLQLGRSRQQALEELAARAPVGAVVEFVGAVVQAELRGNPLAQVLRIQAEVSRRKRTVRAEESAAKAGVAMILPMVLVFFTILILIVAPIVMRIQNSQF